MGRGTRLREMDSSRRSREESTKTLITIPVLTRMHLRITIRTMSRPPSSLPMAQDPAGNHSPNLKRLNSSHHMERAYSLPLALSPRIISGIFFSPHTEF